MNKLIFLAGLSLLAACATPGEPISGRMDWRCSGGAAFSARITSAGAEVFAGGQTYRLPRAEAASGARYANGSVEYWERGGTATLNGAAGGPYENCRR